MFEKANPILIYISFTICNWGYNGAYNSVWVHYNNLKMTNSTTFNSNIKVIDHISPKIN